MTSKVRLVTFRENNIPIPDHMNDEFFDDLLDAIKTSQKMGIDVWAYFYIVSGEKIQLTSAEIKENIFEMKFQSEALISDLILRYNFSNRTASVKSGGRSSTAGLGNRVWVFAYPNTTTGQKTKILSDEFVREEICPMMIEEIPRDIIRNTQESGYW